VGYRRTPIEKYCLCTLHTTLDEKRCLEGAYSRAERKKRENEGNGGVTMSPRAGSIRIYNLDIGAESKAD
jgi:hypothetical protein